jgi:hypothetical protein
MANQVTNYIIKEFAGYQIKQREDGYLNATEMCKVGGKKLSHYNENIQTNEYLNALSTSIGIPADLLIEKIMTGINENRGTWVHPRVAIHLAQWVSPQFAVQVTDWVLRFMSGDLTLVSEIVQRHDEVNDSKSEILITTMSNQLDEYKTQIKSMETQVNSLNKVKDELKKQIIQMNKFTCKYCTRRYAATAGLTRHLNGNCADKMTREMSFLIDLQKFKRYIQVLDEHKVDGFNLEFTMNEWDSDSPELVIRCITNSKKSAYNIKYNERRWRVVQILQNRIKIPLLELLDESHKPVVTDNTSKIIEMARHIQNRNDTILDEEFRELLIDEE